MIEQLPEGDALLEKIGDMFASNAVHVEAVKAYTKVGFLYTETVIIYKQFQAGKVNSAIDLCIQHNRWDVAIDLAKKHNITKISDLLLKYTTHLIEQKQVMTAIEINVQAKFYLRAAEQAFQVWLNSKFFSYEFK